MSIICSMSSMKLFICMWHTAYPHIAFVYMSWYACTLANIKPYTGKFWQGKILVNHVGKTHWRSKGTTASAHTSQIYYRCICEYWQGKFWR